MRLKITQLPKNKHSKMVTSVGWTPTNELYSVSDDKTMLKWGLDGENENKFIDIDVYVTDLKFLQSIRGGSVTAEVFVLGCSDGTFRIMNQLGRLEKSEKAHNGAVTSLAWNLDGTSLLTAGEDGCLKQYSRSGHLRSKLLQEVSPIYCASWSPDQESVIYCTGKYITIKPLSTGAKQTKWKGHDGTILKLDWNGITGLIVSGGEDCKYKIWDSYGQLLFSSKPLEFAITSVSWCPSGDYFAVGSFNSLSLCDKTGWCHSRSSLNSGSILHMDWTGDSTHLAAAGANGAVIFGQVVDRTIEWRNFEIRLDQHNHVHVQDVLNENGINEELEFGYRVIEMSMKYDYLIVVTTKTCYIYHVSNFSTPHIFDLKGTVSLILQSSKYFLLVDRIRGLQSYTYEGRAISNPKLPNMLPQFLKQGNIALSNDTLAIIDRAIPSQIHLLDVQSGKSLCEPIKHEIEVVEISLNHMGGSTDRKLWFIDRNHDLFIVNIGRPNSSYKLATMVDSAIWHESTDVLAALSDSKLIFWYYPSVVYVDRDLVPLTRGVVDAHSFGKGAVFTSFADTRVIARRADGAIQTAAMSPYASSLYKFISSNSWARCTRLCRFVKDEVLWAVLAAMAINSQQLDTAEVALAAIDEVDKLQYIQSVKAIPSAEGRNAELALYKRNPKQAEDILLQADLIYRAIKMNISIFKWQRALELALKYKSHVDTVLAYRAKYLQSLDRPESDERFLKMRDVAIDWNAINMKIEQEIKKEEARGTPYRSTIPNMNIPENHLNNNNNNRRSQHDDDSHPL